MASLCHNRKSGCKNMTMSKTASNVTSKLSFYFLSTFKKCKQLKQNLKAKSYYMALKKTIL